jgi:hypothetical protein|tara:strand:+ start:218 stop:460 length:243 start_codon:yes stop_codon:yes gene_type:complete
MKVGDLVKSKFTFFEGQLGLIVAADIWEESLKDKWHRVKLFCDGDERTVCEHDMEVVKECQENVKSDSNTLQSGSQRVTL